MSQLHMITLDPQSPMVCLPASADTKPSAGEVTAPQSRTGLSTLPAVAGLPGSTMAGLPGFASASPGTYALYRQISAHPTNALVRGTIYAPIAANSWRFIKRRSDVPDEWVEFARQVLTPLRQRIVTHALKALEFGWAGFEKVWEIQSGRRILQKLKPLLWDCTEIVVDAKGNPCGLSNQPSGDEPTILAGSKYFLYTYDSEAGNPYGRSRHENIRQAWAEADQIRQRLAQYMKKVAGIVVQLHYPEGTSRDASGAERPNQWLGQQVLDAVSAGRSVMFPNGFAAGPDIRTAYQLAGQSQWQLSAFEAGGTDHAPGMRSILEYYDALIFRGWLRPERSGLESHFGSKADAQTHTDSGTLDSELIDRDIADAVTRGVVDDLLTQNFGPKAAGAIAIEPAPIESETTGGLKAVLAALLAKPMSPVTQKIDVNALLDQLAVPRTPDAPPA